jgi:hypothetical protein
MRISENIYEKWLLCSVSELQIHHLNQVATRRMLIDFSILKMETYNFVEYFDNFAFTRNRG